MEAVFDANITNRSETDSRTAPTRNVERLARDVEASRRDVFGPPKPSYTTGDTSVVSVFVHVSSAPGEAEAIDHDFLVLNETHVKAWDELVSNFASEGTTLHRLTRATKETSATVSSTASLLRRQLRDARIRSLSPEARATFERIRQLREEIGPIEFDISSAIREFRAGE